MPLLVDGVIIDSYTTTERNALVLPASKLMIYNSTDTQYQVNDGTPAAPVWTASSNLNADDISDAATTNKFVTSGDITNLGNLSGNNTGDQTITLTGDVTGSGTGSFAATIGAKKVTVAKLADGTDGELITWDATGVATTVPTGSAGEILTSNGAGTAPTFQAAGGAVVLQLNWKFDTDTTPTAPSLKKFKMDSATPASVTKLYIDKTAASGTDTSAILSGLAAGDMIYLQQADDATKYILCDVVSLVDNTGWFTITVTIDDSGDLFGNGKDVGFQIFFSSGGGGGGGSLQTISLGAHNAPDLSNASSVYSIKRYLDYQGSASQGAITKITASAYVAGGTGGKIKIYDITNSLLIAEITNISNTSYAVVDLGAITNIPSGAAVFSISLAGDNVNACFCGSVTFKS